MGRDRGSERKSGWRSLDGALIGLCVHIFIALLCFAAGETILYVVGAFFLLEGVIYFVWDRMGEKKNP